MKVDDAAGRYPDWLEVIEGQAPILLIAPHGGTANANGDSSLIPKVNDLHTAAITRELAARLRASALVNSAMDRNLLDCNRVGQLTESAPWFLDLLADLLKRILNTHERVVVLSIHGWNLVHPCVDIGVGLRDRNGTVTPVRGASISVSDGFLDGTLIPLAARLRQSGIAATFGARYPAGDANNLIQTLTARNVNSEVAALKRLADLACARRIEAVQLELSIALRFPGILRSHILEALTDTLERRCNFTGGSEVARDSAIEPASNLSHARTATPRLHAGRLGFEIHDSGRQIGILASFDAGAGWTGARVMIIKPGRTLAMYTCEASPERLRNGIRIGAVDLITHGRSIRIGMRAAMMITPDSASYCDIEGALARSSLDQSVALEVEVHLANSFDVGAAFDHLRHNGPEALTPCFGSASGRIVFNHQEHRLDAVGRVGPAMTSLDGAGFKWRRAIWVVFDGDAGEHAIELREQGSADDKSIIRGFYGKAAVACPAGRFVMADATPSRPPDDITAYMGHGGGRVVSLDGAVTGFVPLVRPGTAGKRIFTMLGLARFTMHGRPGVGMFEQSRLLADDFRFSQPQES